MKLQAVTLLQNEQTQEKKCFLFGNSGKIKKKIILRCLTSLIKQDQNLLDA